MPSAFMADGGNNRMCEITISLPEETLLALKLSPEKSVENCCWPLRSNFSSWVSYPLALLQS
jgi:hypothetical protein